MNEQQRKAMELAIEALETYKGFIDDAHIIEGQWHWIDGLDNVQTAIREALEQPEQEPVAHCEGGAEFCPVCRAETHSLAQPEQESDDLTLAYMAGLSRGKDLAPQRTWVGLTDEEYKNLHLQMGSMYFYQDYGRAIEAKLKEKNT